MVFVFFSSLLKIFALAFSFFPLALPLPHLALLLLLPILPRAQVAAANPAFSKMVVVFSFLCKIFMAFFSFSSSSIFLSSRLACQQPILPTATSLSTAYKLIRSLPSNAPVQPISQQLLLNCFITQTTMKSQSNLWYPWWGWSKEDSCYVDSSVFKYDTLCHALLDVAKEGRVWTNPWKELHVVAFLGVTY